MEGNFRGNTRGRHHPYGQYEERRGGFPKSFPRLPPGDGGPHDGPHDGPPLRDAPWRGRARSRGSRGRGRGRGRGRDGRGSGSGEWGGSPPVGGDDYYDGPYHYGGGGGDGFGGGPYDGDAYREPDYRGTENPDNFKSDPRDSQRLPAHIESRVARERPCRTLFIRNVQYQLTEDDMRREFGKFGEIKNLFDLVDKRGMVFLTYYDIRAAEKAKQEMQGSDLAGRKIDVHFSLPKEEEENQKCDRDKNQGTLFITLRDGKDPLDNDELMKYFSQFGDVKIIREYKGLANALNPNPNAASQRFVEFYDSRACVDAYDATMGLEWHGGTFDVKFAWDQSLKDRHEAFNAKRERPPVEHHNRPPQRFQERHDGPRYDREPPWERDRDDHRGRQHYEDYRGGYDEEDYYTPRGRDQGYEQDNRFGGGYDQGPLHRPPFHPSPGPQASYPQPFSPPQQHLPSFSTPMQQQPYLPTLSAAVSAALAPAVPAVPAALANLSQMTEQQRLEQAQKAQQFLNLFAQQTQQQQVGLAQAPVPTTPTMPPPVLSIPAPAPVVATQTPATTAANQQATALQLLALLGQVQQQQQLQQSQEQIQPASAAAVPLAQFNQLTQLLQQQRSAGGMAGSPSSQAYVPHGYGGQ